MELKRFALETHNTALAEAFGNNKVATLPEVISFLMEVKNNSKFIYHELLSTITSSAHYVGYGEDCKLKIVVAHKVGPLSDPATLQERLSSGRSFKLTAEELLKLVHGEYGKVEVFNLADVIGRKKLPENNYAARLFFTQSEVANSPFWQATLGPDASSFANRIKALYLWMYKDQQHSYGEPLHRNPPVIDLGLDSDFCLDLKYKAPRTCGYGYRDYYEKLSAHAVFLYLGRYPISGSMLKRMPNDRVNYSSISIDQDLPNQNDRWIWAATEDKGK